MTEMSCTTSEPPNKEAKRARRDKRAGGPERASEGGWKRYVVRVKISISRHGIESKFIGHAPGPGRDT